MTYRTKIRTIEAYQFTRDPETDPETPYWLLSHIMDSSVYCTEGRVLWIKPHGSIIGLQQAHIGDYVMYDSSKDEMWVEWKEKFEAKYEPA